MREVVWTTPAQRANSAIIAYLSREVDEATARLIHGLILAAASALGQRSTGRPGRVQGTYEKSVSHTPYIIQYALKRWADRDFVFILSVVHVRRNCRHGQMPPP